VLLAAQIPEAIPSQVRNTWQCIQLQLSLCLALNKHSQNTCELSIQHLWSDIGATNKLSSMVTAGFSNEILMLCVRLIEEIPPCDVSLELINHLYDVASICLNVSTNVDVLVSHLYHQMGRRLLQVDDLDLKEAIEVEKWNDLSLDNCKVLGAWLVILLRSRSSWQASPVVLSQLQPLLVYIVKSILLSCSFTENQRSYDIRRSRRVALIIRYLAWLSVCLSEQQQHVLFEELTKQGATENWLIVLSLWLAPIMCLNVDDLESLAQCDADMVKQGKIYLDAARPVEKLADRALFLQESLKAGSQPDALYVSLQLFAQWRMLEGGVLRSILDLETLVNKFHDLHEFGRKQHFLKSLLLKDSEEICADWEDITCFIAPKAYELNEEINSSFKLEGNQSLEADERRRDWRDLFKSIENPSQEIEFNDSLKFIQDYLLDAENMLSRWSKREGKGICSSNLISGLLESREENIPECLAKAQSHLWEIYRQLDQYISSKDGNLMELVSNQYEPVQYGELQNVSVAVAEGESVPVQLHYRDHNERCMASRNEVLHETVISCHSKHIKMASIELFKMEYFVKICSLFSVHDKQLIVSKMTTLLLESLIFGTTPRIAGNYLISFIRDIFTQGLAAIDPKIRTDIVFYIIRELQKSIPSHPLDQVLAVKLLNILLEPSVLLDSDKLSDFFELLKFISSLNEGNWQSEVTLMLSNFAVSYTHLTLPTTPYV